MLTALIPVSPWQEVPRNSMRDPRLLKWKSIMKEQRDALWRKAFVLVGSLYVFIAWGCLRTMFQRRMFGPKRK
jgi:hypothetical protein